MSKRSVLAIAAHPDDIEFMMAGTLLLLKEAGCEIHYLNVANGSCGSLVENMEQTRATRDREARAAADILEARFHASLVDDIQIFYEAKLLRRIAAIVREVRPILILTHSPEDYMEDHMNTARLAVTAGFVRGMPNFVTNPRRKAVTGDLTLYHALPHGLRDGLGRRVLSEGFIDVASVHATKMAALSAHRSQQDWLNQSQGMNSYLKSMEASSREIGRMSGQFQLAEGWRRHNPLGFCSAHADPLQEILGSKYYSNPAYRHWLESDSPDAWSGTKNEIDHVATVVNN